jgi:hypothetical protein
MARAGEERRRGRTRILPAVVAEARRGHVGIELNSVGKAQMAPIYLQEHRLIVV